MGQLDFGFAERSGKYCAEFLMTLVINNKDLITPLWGFQLNNLIHSRCLSRMGT